MPTETDETPARLDPATQPMSFRVLGRTLEHFGVQMYKRREVAIAELVANCWDAGAPSVLITVPAPEGYDPLTSKITIRDTGCGMDHAAVQGAYLVLGRNRRKTEGEEVEPCLPLDFGKTTAPAIEKPPESMMRRRVMGRKGIGKLAGFGLAQKITVTTWRENEGLEFYLDLAQLKLEDNDSKDVEINWKWIEPKKELSPSGTTVTLDLLKHKTPVDADSLRRSLARRFSRTVRGEMGIKVNEIDLPDPTPPWDKREPAAVGDFMTETLSDNNEARYWYAFASDPIHDRELRGFAVMVHGKVAQAPPFFFDVEAKASGQHATRYLVGEIEADYVDNGIDDEGDLVSTDRQEIDWEDARVAPLKAWGEELVRRLLIECTAFRGAKTEKEILDDPLLKDRIQRLEKTSQDQIRAFLRILGTRDSDDGRTADLADGLIRAYEFRQFHDVIAHIEKAAEDADQLARLLQQLHEWRVLESRAILEIVKGRLDILDRFERMLCNDAPETASPKNPDNMHDLLAGNPWLLNPEWQVLYEEKGITRQLREWGKEDLPDYDGRYDFLALGSEGLLAVIEIKRPNYAAELVELQRLQEYANRLSMAHNRPMKMVFICGREVKVSPEILASFEGNPNFEIRRWHKLFERTRNTYEHYRSLLEGSVGTAGFVAKEEEVRRTRTMLDHGIRRRPTERAKGIPPQDVSHEPQAITDPTKTEGRGEDLFSQKDPTTPPPQEA